MERKIIYLDDAIDALRYAQHRFTVADEAGGMGTVKWSEDVIYFATAERVLAELPSAQPGIVRCKDCKFYSPMNRETKTGICNLIMHQNFGDNWFCAGAERRPDESDRKRRCQTEDGMRKEEMHE